MTLLIVEDDDNLRAGIKDLLELESIDVITAADGLEGLELFKQQSPSFCVLDIMLPGLNGIKLCKEIRLLDQAVPILMLSARGEEIDKILGLEAGADDYMLKPFGPRELIARIKAISRRANNQHTPQTEEGFVMGDLLIEPHTLRAFREKTVIDLTKRDIRLLTILFENRGKPVERDILYDLGWGREFIPNSRALDQYIVSLRQKIELNPTMPKIIKTVRGSGYRFDPLP